MSFFKPKRIPLQKTKSDDPFTTTQSIDSSLYIDDEDPSDAFYLKGSNLKTKLDSYNHLIQKVRDCAIKLETQDQDQDQGQGQDYNDKQIHDSTGQRSNMSLVFKELESLETSIRFDFSSLSKTLDSTSLKKINYYNDLIKSFSNSIPNARTTFQMYRTNYLQYLLSTYGNHSYGSDFEFYIGKLKSDEEYLKEMKSQDSQQSKEIVTYLRNASLELSKIDSSLESLVIVQSELSMKKYEGSINSNDEKMIVNQNNKYGSVPAITVSSIEDGYLSHKDNKRKKRKRLIWVLLTVCLILIGIGLGCGLGLGLQHANSSNSSNSSNDNSGKSISTSSSNDSGKTISGHALFASSSDLKKSSGKSNTKNSKNKSATFATSDQLKSKKHMSAKYHKKPKKNTSSSKKTSFATSDQLKSKSSSTNSKDKSKPHDNYKKTRHDATKIASSKKINRNKTALAVKKSHKAITKARKSLARKKHLIQSKK